MGGVIGTAASLLRLLGILALLVCSIFSTGVVGQEGKTPGLGEVLAGQKNLTTFYDLIRPPTNEAFERIPLTSLNGLWNPDDAAVAVPILQYHIVAGQFPADAMQPGAPAFNPTYLTSPRWTNLTSGGQLVRADKQPDGFVALTTGSGSRSSLVPLSADGRLRDLHFTGGIVQAVDNLLIPPTALKETLTAYSDLSFLGALYAAGLYDEFAQCGRSGNCTIFAPSVRAFRAVNSTLAGLSRDDLAAVLRYHLVPGQVLTSNLLLNGTVLRPSPSSRQQLQVRRAGNYLYLGSAQLVQQDILFANGAVHLLDNVLNPFLSPRRRRRRRDAQPGARHAAPCLPHRQRRRRVRHRHGSERRRRAPAALHGGAAVHGELPGADGGGERRRG
ncbi:uncharacterized protein PG986_003709 [Apiospora aurea]|uniref:FAS1 domain-containing protein n=1 Tax=Apiospora aurea TaxID=335848 RepID=A0ABR1QSH2_9PEZI